MRSRALLTFVFTASIFALPVIAHAGGIPFFGPIIPQDANQNVCPASWGMLITIINNIISLLLTLAIVFVAPLMIAYSGFLFVVNPVNASGKEEAKKILTNTVVGIVIALAGWLIVDAVMAVLYHPSDSTWGAWSGLVYGNSNDVCLKQEGALPGDQLKQAPPGTGVTATGGVSTGPLSLCSSSNTACSPAVLQAAGFNAAQANAMSCIAVTESSGIPDGPDSKTGACGLFQITNRPGNWSNAAFHKSPCSTTSSCKDPVCNTQTAQIMFSQQGYQPWTCSGCNAKAQNCVNQYDPGH